MVLGPSLLHPIVSVSPGVPKWNGSETVPFLTPNSLFTPTPAALLESQKRSQPSFFSSLAFSHRETASVSFAQQTP